ncbi:hypothetical protein [Streptomyces ardesiacus]|uniref:hypothetical protein n=1 Tax=Streptomyces ardesiacus TaxID=285564 RepID=UPI0036AE22ED
MNWADLLNALLVAGMVMPLLLMLLGLLATTRAIAIQIAALTLLTVSAFWRGDADGTVLYASTNMVLLLVLRRSRARAKARAQDNNKDRGENLSKDQDRTPGPERTASKGSGRSTDQVHVITSVKKPCPSQRAPHCRAWPRPVPHPRDGPSACPAAEPPRRGVQPPAGEALWG